MKTNCLFVFAVLSVVGCSRTDQPTATITSSSAVGNSPGLLETPEYKKISAVEKRLQLLSASSSAEEMVRIITEVDEWLIAPEEEEQARKLIDAAIEKLRARIAAEVTALAKAAITVPKGKEASVKMSEINKLLALYPLPRTEPQRKSLEDLSSFVLSTSRRVEDIRRLRYNSWSVEQVKNGMELVRLQTSGLKGMRPDKDALLKTCTDHVKNLDPGFLEPAALNLYAEFLRRCDAEMDDDRKVNLARALVDPSLQRRTLSDF